MDLGFARVAVTGVGVVSALANSAGETFDRLVAGHRGFGPVSLFDVKDLRCGFAAEVPGRTPSDITADAGSGWSRTDAMALVAAREALAASGRTRGDRLAFAVGATTGGMLEAERGFGETGAVSRLLSHPISTTADLVGDEIGAGPRVTICSACSSGANAIVQGAAWIATGRETCALVGGVDGLCQLTFAGFNALGVLDRAPCRPFDVTRAGMSLGEGAAFLVLEPLDLAIDRGARVLAVLSGSAVGAEAHHITHPEPSGAVPTRMIATALERANLAPGQIDYVNAHGTGTLLNDSAEAGALASALGESRPFVSSSKGQLGHTLAAAGAIEAALTVMALDRGIVPGTGGLEQPEETPSLRHVIGGAVRVELGAAMSTSFGFGGSGTVLVFERPAAAAATATATGNRRSAPICAARVVVTGALSMGPLGLLDAAASAAYVEPASSAPGKRLPDPELDSRRSRRFDRMTQLIVGGAGRAMSGADLDGEGIGLVVGSSFGNIDRTTRFLRRIADKGPGLAHPAEFPHILPSAPSGNASIYLGLTGPVVTVGSLTATGECAAAVAASFVAAGVAGGMIAGSVEWQDPAIEAAQPERETLESGAWLVLEDRAHARRRGAAALAEVVGWSQTSREPGGPGVSSPGTALPSVVSTLTDWESLDLPGWADAPRYSVAANAGRHASAGAVAMAAGVGLIVTKRANEVLVCGGSTARTWLVHLVEVAE